MRRPIIRLAAACAFAAAAAVFPCAALAGGGHGGGDDHGQGQVSDDHGGSWDQKQDDHNGSGEGVKPSNETKHWTKTTVGHRPDDSKRYGNGETAAQIAKSRGASDDTVLTGPGNSQPHKVSDCRHKSNRSGGVDVHAIKHFGDCKDAVGTHEIAEQHEKKPCGSGEMQGKHEEENEAGSCAHVVAQVAAAVQQPAPVQVVVTPAPAPAAAPVPQPAAPAPQQASAAAPPSTESPQAQGQVLGAQTTLGKPASQGGVLGTVGGVAGANLPFTGFPVWLAVLIALTLLLAGFTLHRRGGAGTRI